MLVLRINIIKLFKIINIILFYDFILQNLYKINNVHQ